MSLLQKQKPIVLDNEQKVQPKNDVKNNSGSVVREYNETGMAAWIKDGSLNQNKYYALHRTAPLGTIVKVNNRMNGEYVFVKVVGQLPDSGDNEKQIIKISEAAAKK
ncbi:MAG: peptidoglycan-binding protein, partial [Bacteroidetes bacterium]|nr:peptidoglycan-binding protein [Bacteroidota bacterium]